MSDVVPFNLEAEESVLGAMILSTAAIREVKGAVEVGDFFRPAHGVIFEAIMNLHARGERADVVTIAEEVRRSGKIEHVAGDFGFTMVRLNDLQANTPTIESAGRYAAIVAEHSLGRKLISFSDAVRQRASALSDPIGLLDSAKAELEAIDIPIAVDPHVMEWGDAPAMTSEEDGGGWVIPGLMRRRWRVVLVGPEGGGSKNWGGGKSTISRQIGVPAAFGLHGLHVGPDQSPVIFEPQPILIFDCENSPRTIWHDPWSGIEKLSAECRRIVGNIERAPSYVVANEEKVDIRSRVGRMKLEEAIRRTRPALVVCGPLYKMFDQRSNEKDEVVANEIIDVFDDLRVRYDCAFLIEHHAPKATGNMRSMDPAGSMVLLRWPDIGIKLLPKAKTTIPTHEVGRFRGDRVENAWPDELVRPQGLRWPWRGYWETNNARKVDAPDEDAPPLSDADMQGLFTDEEPF